MQAAQRLELEERASIVADSATIAICTAAFGAGNRMQGRIAREIFGNLLVPKQIENLLALCRKLGVGLPKKRLIKRLEAAHHKRKEPMILMQMLQQEPRIGILLVQLLLNREIARIERDNVGLEPELLEAAQRV